MTAESAAGRERIRAIDAARGIAVIAMIGGHVSDAFLADRWRDGPLWYALDIGFGFVAPTFLFLSGVTLGLALARSDPKRHARRLLKVLALAYWLQIPILSLRQLVWNHRADELARLFDSNILHVVAITGLFAIASYAMLGTTRSRAVAATLAVAVIVVTPIAAGADIAALVPLPLRALVATQPRATFPLLPYAAYSLIGFAVAPVVTRLGRRASAIALAAGVAALVIARLAYPILHPDAGVTAFWYGSIEHTLFRLGGVVALVGAAFALAPRQPSGRSALERIGALSLAIYTLHLMLVYGSPMTMGARSWFGGTLARALGPVATLAAFALVAALTCAAALAWPRLRRAAPGVARGLAWSWWLAFAAFFLLTP